MIKMKQKYTFLIGIFLISLCACHTSFNNSSISNDDNSSMESLESSIQQDSSSIVSSQEFSESSIDTTSEFGTYSWDWSYSDSSSSCFSSKESINTSVTSEEEKELVSTNITFPNIPTLEDYPTFISSVINGTTWNNDKAAYGIVTSPYFKAFVDGEEYEVYAGNVTYGLLSFTYIKRLSDSSINVEVQFNENIVSLEVFSTADRAPIYSYNGKSIYLELFDSTSYTLLINNNKEKAITLFLENEVKFKQETSKIAIYKPNTYDFDIKVGEDETAYFKAGYYKIRKFTLNNNSQIYFEDGTYIECLDPSNKTEKPIIESDNLGLQRFSPFIEATDVNNIKIFGHAIIDLSRLSFHARNGLKLLRCKNVYLADMLFNNSPEWTMNMCCTIGLTVENCKIIGYRMNSDGYALVDCQTATVSNCFARSGDDLFEVKSMYGAETIEIKDITFDKCVAWPEKARGLGVIAETKRDIKNVTWKNSIVCAAPPKWQDALGALIVFVENDGTISNIRFENIQIYHHDHYPINVTLGKNSAGHINGVYFKNIKYYSPYYVRMLNDSTKQGVVENITFDQVYYKTTHITANCGYISKQGTISNINYL